MSKIYKCDRCLFNAHNPLLVCAIHPSGVESDDYLDFRSAPDAEVSELWQPEGVRFIDGELVVDREPFYFYYDCFPINNYLTPEEKVELLDTHPMFTGRCPQCEIPYPQFEQPPVHWDCDQCGWLDDTI